MSQAVIVNRPRWLAVATTITAVGFLTATPPALARPLPPLPLAPACSQWGFPGSFSLKQSTGDTVGFNATGPVATGPATATGGINGPLQGNVHGGIQGDKLDFDINWGIAFNHPSVGHYSGVVGSDGFAHGDTADEFSSNPSAHWDSTVPLVCSTPAASDPGPASAPAPQPAPAPRAVPHQPVPTFQPAPAAGAVATVSSDVDVYDGPGGNGNKVGILRTGRQVKLVGSCKPNDWCDVVVPELPAGNGWVWDQFLQF
jgi:hypothetical protein